jgi:hypothetical protein
MYSRDFQPSRATPIEAGAPVAGTWNRAFDDVNLLDVHRPFNLPLPKSLRDYRIKEWQSFQAQDERYYLTAALINAKYYRLAHVVLWNKETKEKLSFNKVLPFGAWKFPRSLSNASVTSRSWGFYFRVHDWLDADVAELDIDIEPTRRRPSFTAHLELDLRRTAAVPIVVCLPFAGRRCLYAFKTLAPARGDLVFGGRHIAFEPDKASGTVFDYRGFYPYRMHSSWATGFGFDGNGRRFGFSLAENQAKDAFKNNENALWVDGQLTLLPPVRITQAEDCASEWVIQDLEGMVDLSFAPREQSSVQFNLFLTRCDYRAPLGVFNGMVATAAGEKIAVRNLWGFAEKLYIRV